MKRIVREWVEKAEGDYATALRELRARRTPNYDACCFHAQQCAEKYLKALMQDKGIVFGRVHHLILLLDLLLPEIGMLELLRAELQALNQFAVDYRYPGESADKAQAADAVKTCRRVRRMLRQALGLPIEA